MNDDRVGAVNDDVLERGLRDAETWRHVDRSAAAKPAVYRGPDAFISYLRQRSEETAEARALVAELLKYTTSRGWFAAASRKRYHTAAVVRDLLASADSLFSNNPSLALEHTQRAIFIANLLAAGPEKDVLLGFAHKELANMLWNVNRYRDALVAADQAEAFYRRVAGTDELAAIVDVVRAVIFQRMGERLDEAEELLRSAAEVFLEHANHDKYMDARLTQGMIEFRRGKFADAQKTFTEVVGAAARYPRTLAQAYNNLAHCWAELGRPELAAAAFHTALALYRDLGMQTEIPRVTWGFARLQFETGHSLEALKLYREAQAAFQGAGKIIGAAAVSLEVVELLIAVGDFDGAALEAEPLPARFAAEGMPTKAIEAANYVREITRLRRATREKVKHVRTFVQNLAAHPDLDFSPPE